VNRADQIISPEAPVLVTGAGGFIGAKVVEILLEYGFTDVRCFVRPSSKLERLHRALAHFPAGKSARVITGDLLSPDDCRAAVDGVSVIFHLAAGMDKSFAGAFMNSALATRNLVEAFLDHGAPKRFVNVSSFAVYSNLKLERGAVLDESCPLEDAPQQRADAYCFGKLKQDEIVTKYGRERGLPYVIVRPGSVFGPGKAGITGRVGIDTFGFFIHLGGSNQLPLTFVDNCADAIVFAGLEPGVEGEVFNVVDDDPLTSAEFLRAYKQAAGRFFSVPVPYFVAETLCKLWERYSHSSKGQLPAVFNHRRCAAEWKGNRFSNQKLHEKLGWQPRVKMKDAIASYIAHAQVRSA
jgi:nucleoside-diphosphate-sugar epimerase